jgi:hypothetical protein
VLEWGAGAGVDVPELEVPELEVPELEDDEELPDRPGISRVMSSTMLLSSLSWSSLSCSDSPSSPEPDTRLSDEVDEFAELELLAAVAAWAVPDWWSFQYMRPPRPRTATALRTAAMRRASHARGRRGPVGPGCGSPWGVWGAAIGCSLSERLGPKVRTASQRGVRGR